MSEDEGEEEAREKALDSPGMKNLGRSEILLGADLTPPLTPVVPPGVITLINVQGSDSESQFMTVYLEADVAVPGSPADDLVWVVADVSWGNGGHQTQALIDFSVGTAFSLAASFLRVKARLDPQFFSGGGGNILASIRCSAFVNYGTRPAQAQAPTRTLVVGDVAPGGGSGRIRIPAYARSVTFVGRQTNPPIPFEIRFHRSDNALFIANVFNPNIISVPIQGEARYFSLVNPTPDQVLGARFLFELAF